MADQKRQHPHAYKPYGKESSLHGKRRASKVKLPSNRPVVNLNDCEEFMVVGGLRVYKPRLEDLDIKLSAAQQKAFDAVMDKSNRLVLVAGSPGSGKTTITKKAVAIIRKQLQDHLVTYLQTHKNKAEIGTFYQILFQRQASVIATQWTCSTLVTSDGVSWHSAMSMLPANEKNMIEYTMNEDGTPDLTVAPRLTAAGDRHACILLALFLKGRPHIFPLVVFVEECSKMKRTCFDVLWLMYESMTRLLNAKFQYLATQPKGSVLRDLGKPPRIILSGDFFQHRPILSDGEHDEDLYMSYFFRCALGLRPYKRGEKLDSTVSKNAFYLLESIRQKDKRLFWMIQRVKLGTFGEKDDKIVESCTYETREDAEVGARLPLYICGKQATVQAIGAEKYALLQGSDEQAFPRVMTFSQEATDLDSADGAEEAASVPISESDAAKRAAAYKLFKASKKQMSDHLPEIVILKPGTRVRATRPIKYEKYVTDAHGQEIPVTRVIGTNTMGMVTRMHRVNGEITGVYIRLDAALGADEVGALSTGIALAAHKDDVLVVPTEYEQTDTTYGFVSREVLLPLAMSYAVTMESIQGVTLPGDYHIIVLAYEAWMLSHKYVIFSRIAGSLEDFLRRFRFVGRFRYCPIDEGAHTFSKNLQHIC